MEKETKFWLITILGTGIIVIGLFVIFFTWRAYTYYRTHVSVYTGKSFFIPDPVIGFRHRPNVTLTMKDPKITFYTDDRGGRAPRPGMRAPAHVDVLAIGGSFTWGHAIKDKDTFIRIIGRDLDLTTYNAGVSSYGTTTSLLSLKNYEDLKPKIVIYGFITDHINRSLNPCAPCISGLCRGVAHIAFDSRGNPFIAKPVTSPLYYEHLKDVIVVHKFGLKDIYWEILRTFNYIPKWEPTIDKYNNKQIISAMNYLMKQMVHETKKMGARLVIVYIPNPEAIKPPPKELMEAIDDILTEHQTALVDLTLPFLEAQKRHESLSTKDKHPNVLANRIIANNVEPAIRSILNR